MIKIYISGKVTNNPNFRKKFAEAERYLKDELNVEPINPVAGLA